MDRNTLLGLYKRLTGLLEKLPGGLQKPILKELVPIQQLFLEQRPARLLFLGDDAPPALTFLQSLVPALPEQKLLPSPENTEQPPLAPASLVEMGACENGWQTYQVGKRWNVQVLDARHPDFPETNYDIAIQNSHPDAILIFQGGEGMATAHCFQDALAKIKNLDPSKSLIHKQDHPVQPTPTTPHATPVIIGVATGTECEPSLERLRALLHCSSELANRGLYVFPENQPQEIAKTLSAQLPNEAKLEFALFCNLRSAQAEIAKTLLTSFTAVCGVIGLQPIPLADLPVLATLQSLMVGLIAYTSGRRLEAKTVTEFCGAVGMSLGLGMLFREGARSLIKVIPGFGNAVSGMVAGAGTYAIGRSAIAYFIEDLPAVEAQKLFRTINPKWTTFLRKRKNILSP